MKKLLDTPASAALVSAILVSPVLLFVLIAGLGIEPVSSLLEGWGGQPPGDQLLPILGCLLLAMALAVSIRSILQTLRLDGTLAGNPGNVFIVAAITAFAVVILVANVADQLPCWLGRPNCH